MAVVNQTIAGLAQGREITGNVVYLGGPLTFFSRLREAFDRILGVKGICPENSLYYVAAGAALSEAGEEFDLEEITDKIRHYSSSHHYQASSALFQSQAEYEEFVERHQRDKVDTGAPLLADKKAYVGIDAGSTTVKAVAVNEDGDIIFSHYLPNSGNPVPLVREFLLELYRKFPDIQICSAASTGYGEEIIKNAFGLDMGVVETIAHFTAARKFEPEVDFIIDIGGQDIKCFQIKNGTIDNIFLNEACSSGCGSFLQTFAGALGYQMADFARLGLFADSPVDLGSRCTVFMNSSVKQAQKDGASIENISAGLSMSVVKNALYKVIRVVDAASLGKHIVVQGGTFLNDAVLRAFEKEIGQNVTRPSVSGLMGAYGAALYAKEHSRGKSGILDAAALERFTHEVRAITCNGCQNHCRLTVNSFANGAKYIAGNRCDKPLQKHSKTAQYNLYDYKRQLLDSYTPCKGPRGTIGIPMGLNLYELYPFWYTFFTKLGFGVVRSPESDRKLYFKGQHTIPSDTVCYPAKLMHGHIEALLEMGPDAIFYPLYELQRGRTPGGQPLQLPGGGLLPRGAGRQRHRAGAHQIHLRLCGPAPAERFPQKDAGHSGEIFPRHPGEGGAGGQRRRLRRVPRPHGAHPAAGPGVPGAGKAPGPAGDHPLRPALPPGPGGEPRHRQAHLRVRGRGGYRGFGERPGEEVPHRGAESVDVPRPAVRRRQVCGGQQG